MGHTHATPDRCPNCSNPLKADDRFCSRCGQENHSLRVPFKHLMLEALEGLLHLDSKSLRTLRLLAFKPGFLTKEFMAGRRAQYVQPVRLYVFISFLFFLLFSVLPGRHSGDPGSSQINFSFYNVSSEHLKGLNESQRDSLMKARGIELTPLNRYVTAQISRIATGGREEFNHLLLKGVSYMMFLLMPLFGLLIFLLFHRRVEYYVDCLIFSLHFHSFVFLLISCYLLLNVMVSSALLGALVVLIIGLYLYRALNVIYGQTKITLMLKTASLGALHLLSIVLSLATLVFISIVVF